MGFWSNLFGGSTPEERAAGVASQANARARCEARDTAENEARAIELLDRALGNDPGNDSRAARQKAAITLVLANEMAKGREAWLSISRDYPSELSLALEQIGVCYHLEKDYGSALESYQAAIRVGADAGHLADNMEEARKGMAAFG